MVLKMWALLCSLARDSAVAGDEARMTRTGRSHSINQIFFPLIFSPQTTQSNLTIHPAPHKPSGEETSREASNTSLKSLKNQDFISEVTAGTVGGSVVIMLTLIL